VILLVVVLLGTLLAAVAGGKAGERYHRRVDRAGYEGAREEAAHHRETRTTERTA
jgi:hypothetical protein